MRDAFCKVCGVLFRSKIGAGKRTECCSIACRDKAGTRSIADRFWEKVTQHHGDACWEWSGAPQNGGYGSLGTGGKYGAKIRAHVFSYIIHTGPVPDGMVVRHTCDNPPCTNPKHLIIGTQKDNIQDMISRGRKNPFRKITDQQVVEIRRLLSLGVPPKELAEKFGCSRPNISMIKNGKSRVMESISLPSVGS